MKKIFSIIQNAGSFARETVPVVNIHMWRKWIIETCKQNEGRIVSIFGHKETEHSVRLFAVLGIDAKSELQISSADVESGKYPSITKELTEAHLFERELYEEFGILPEGHPWLKPVRKFENYDFYSMTGNQVHEVAVGPVHAGVIEPGHFRFQCHGEKVFNLEIRLGYQRRGIEELLCRATPVRRLMLAESVVGDSVVGHTLAYCHVIEGLADRQVTQRARIVRAVALELERVANHVGDLSALAGDVGFLPAASYLGKLRADFLNLLMMISGNRFGRCLLKPGGVAFDIDADMMEVIKGKLAESSKTAAELIDLLFSTVSVISRFENTGTVKQETAKELGMVGVSARASGLARDVRINYPCGVYRFRKIMMAKAVTGDIFARARVRSLEIKRSLEFVSELLAMMSQDKVFFQVEKLKPSSLVVSLIEEWRGEIVHIAMTNENSKLARYKIVDPSFRNWPGLSMALRNGQISDFPLCNKSFNLSYAGHDL